MTAEIDLNDIPDYLRNPKNGLRKYVQDWCRENRIKYTKKIVDIEASDFQRRHFFMELNKTIIVFESAEDLMAFKLRWFYLD